MCSELLLVLPRFDTKIDHVLNCAATVAIENTILEKTMYQAGYELRHPVTDELHAIFQGYTDSGEEIWRTPNGIERCTFDGFTDDGWCRWSQSVEEFAEQVQDE